MKLHNLVKIKNIKPAKRLGRGLSSGKGQTSGRGTKGQKSRSGYNIPRRFEGGQTPLIARIAKAKGFHSIHTKPAIVHILDIEKHFSDNEVVNFKTLTEKKLVNDVSAGVKILGPGHLGKKLRFYDVKLSKKLLSEMRTDNKTDKTKINKKATANIPTVREVAMEEEKLAPKALVPSRRTQQSAMQKLTPKRK